MKYAPGLPPTDDARLREYIQKELLKISDTIDQIHLHEKSYKTPAKPQDGQVEFADGTNWNPDATNGEGLYRYDASSDTWKYLEGSGTSNSPLTTKGDVWGYSTLDARIPVGTDDQVLTADSTAALGVSWQDAAGGFTSPLTTKGDIHVYSTTDTRLPVSATDGQMLVADSGETTGLNWANPGLVKELVFTENITNSNFSNSYTILTTVTFAKKETSTGILAFCSGNFYSPSGVTSGANITLQIRESSGSPAGAVSKCTHDVAETWHDMSGFDLFTGVSAGSHTWQVRGLSSTTDIYSVNRIALVVIEIA